VVIARTRCGLARRRQPPDLRLAPPICVLRPGAQPPGRRPDDPRPEGVAIRLNGRARTLVPRPDTTRPDPVVSGSRRTSPSPALTSPPPSALFLSHLAVAKDTGAYYPGRWIAGLFDRHGGCLGVHEHTIVEHDSDGAVAHSSISSVYLRHPSLGDGRIRMLLRTAVSDGSDLRQMIAAKLSDSKA